MVLEGSHPTKKGQAVATPNTGPRLFTYDDAAQRLGMSVRWLEDRVQRGEIPHRKMGRSVRFTDADLATIVRMYRAASR